MRQFNAGWFYLKLCLANAWFIVWYTTSIHLSSRGFLIAASLCAYTLLLVVFHTLIWNTTALSHTDVVPQTISQRLAVEKNNVREAVYTPDSLAKREKYLQALLTKQSTHRDALINLALISYSLGSTAEAAQLISQARQLDPNHPFLVQF